MTRQLAIAFLTVFLAVTVAHGQTALQTVDTVKIYKNKTGVRYQIYLRNWFFGYGIRHSYSWRPEKVNKQDSLVMEPHPQRYFKVYDSKNRLIFEGASGFSGTYLEGDIKYYHKSGHLKRIEQWGNNQGKDTCNTSFGFNDAPGHQGAWKYFRKNGTLKKRTEYIIIVTSCIAQDFSVIKQTTKFKRNGKIKSIKRNKYRG